MINLPDPLEDTSRWTFTGSRFDFNWDAYEYIGEQITEMMQQYPADDPVRQLWETLPKAQRP